MFFVFLFIATLLPNPSFVGKYGEFLGNSNFLLFGYISYLIPFYFIALTYAFYKDLDRQVFEKLFAVFIGIINFLIIQSMLFNVGVFGNLFVESLKPLIGVIGLSLLVLSVFILTFLLFNIKIDLKLLKQKQQNKIKIDKPLEKEEKEDKQFQETPEEYIKRQLKNVHEIEDDLELGIEDISKNEESKNKEVSLDSQEKVEVKEKEIENEEKEEFTEVKEKEIQDTKTKINEIKEKEIEKESKNEIEIQNTNTDISEIKDKEIVEKEHIDAKKAIIIEELDENKELLNSIEKGNLEKPKDFQLPSLDFLAKPKANKKQIDEEEIDKKVQLLLNKLKNFKIEGDVVRTYTGPVVTTFEFKPLAHIKVSKILNLADDLAMALKASTIRIQAPVPGKDVVGIEIPNSEIETIYLREILESNLFKESKSPLVIALGKDIVGKPFVTDLAKLPHVLIAGTTGSGKSVGINAMILSLLYRNSPDNLKLMMIDPKMLEFSIYNDIPHLLTPVITEPKKAITGLNNMVKEMERRYKLMSDAKVKNIENYNTKFPENKMPYIVVIIDELADLMMTGGKDVEYSIARLAQMARASGIHLIVATQRPSVDVVTGLIKANLPSRISFKVGQKIDSKVVLDQYGAESLLGRGDMLFTPPGSSTLVRLHAPFTTEEEIEKIVEFLKSQRVADYDENFLSESVDDESSMDVTDKDELFEEAKQIILKEGKTSISYLQRRLQIGYNRAANIIEQLQASGFLSEPNARGQREILV